MASTSTLQRPSFGGIRSSSISPGVSTSDPLQTSRFHQYPPSWTLQPNLATRGSQLASWSSLVQKWCAFHRRFRLVLADVVESPLFHNAAIGRRLNLTEIQTVIEFMVSGRVVATGSSSSAGTSTATDGSGGGEDGKQRQHEQRAEWTSPERTAVWIFWRRPEEWADLLADWVESTGQKGVVMTLYELVEGDNTQAQDFHGMPDEMLRKVLQVLVKRGKAQIFGASGEQGVKFF